MTQPRKTKLLIAEDEPDLLANLTEFFDSLGFETHAADNGARALQKAKDIVPDVVVSDLVMPEIGGLELLELLKANQSTKHIPVIILSARVESEIQEAALRIGSVQFVTKPFSLAKLWETIERSAHLPGSTS